MVKVNSWTHHYGGDTPMRVTGIHQSRLMEFAEIHRCWHTCHPRDQWRVDKLAQKGYLEVVGDQFRFKYPDSFPK